LVATLADDWVDLKAETKGSSKVGPKAAMMADTMVVPMAQRRAAL